ncbi:hypothetical protein R1flu_006356 [Riccia fluitans]|uniref:Uncharacterized protein n=1 Tax=Riccia fluitans TaxID=41844 RepID=A0ABD1YVT1_9MARC
MAYPSLEWDHLLQELQMPSGDLYMLLLEMVATGQCAFVQAAASEVVAEKSSIATEPSVVEPSSSNPHERHWLPELMSVESVSPDLTQVAIHLSNWMMAWPAIVPKSLANAMVESDEIRSVACLEFQNRVQGTLAIACEFS